MANERPASAPVGLIAELEQAPHDFGFFQAVRRLEAAYPSTPPIGTSLLPGQEAVRFGRRPSLAFEPNAVPRFLANGGERPHRMEVAFAGLFGANGELPHAYTRFALEQIARRRQHRGGGVGSDTAEARRAPVEPGRAGGQPPAGSGEPFSDFVDIFQHRVLSTLYRAWALSRPAVGRDRSNTDLFARALSQFAGFGGERARGAINRDFALFFSARLGLQPRSAEGLSVLVASLLRVPAEIEQFIGEWLDVPEAHAWRLGNPAPPAISPPGDLPGALGEATVVGAQVYHRQYRFRLVVGPVSREQFLRLLPGGDNLAKLTALVQHYVGDELCWDLSIKLEPGAVEPVRLGETASLGVASYLVHSCKDAPEVHRVTPF